jgi:uncharacterized membrane protein YqjE
VLAVVLAVMFMLPFEPARMGDYADFTRDFWSHFSDVRFQYHLGAAVLRGFYAIFKTSRDAPVDAFDALARLASTLFIGGLAGLALFQRFSPRVLRYIGIVLAAPSTLLMFGYHELGYEPTAAIVTAIPLGLLGLETGRQNLVLLAAFLLGVGVAFHGFGLVSLVFLILLIVVWQAFLPRSQWDVGLPLRAIAAGLVGWLMWLPLYFIGFGWTVEAGHADQVPFRPLFHTTRFMLRRRFDYAVFSQTGLRDIAFEFIILGLIPSLLVLLMARDAARRTILLASIPVVFFVILFWPLQGLGNDTDNLPSIFPSLYAAGWLLSRSKRWSLVALVMLAISQLALLYVIHGLRFVHSQDF